MARHSFKVTAFTIVAILAILLNTAARWFPSLRLIVWAFFTGIAASLALLLVLVLLTVHHGDGDGPYSSHDALRSIKPLAFTSSESWAKEVEAIALEDLFHRVPLHPPSFVLSDSLDVFLDCILRGFVNSWYSAISEDQSFTIQVDRVVRHSLEHLRDRLQSLDLVEAVVGKIVPLLTSHLHDFSAAERIVRGKHLNKNLTESEELDLAIASKYRDGKLHPAASLKFSDTKLAQQDHLRKVAESILPSVLPQKEKKSKVVGVIVKEIVACAIIFPIMGMLSDPDFWNQFIEAIGRSTLQDRKTVRKLRAALDEHATPRQSNLSYNSKYNPQAITTSSQPFIRLSPKDDERTFERFIRSIRMCANLSDARRLRNEISAQLKRDERVGGNEGWSIYIKRLETGKRVVDQKVSSLSAANTTPGVGPLRSQSEMLLKGQPAPSRLEFATLDQVLRDSSGLSYFMEHMDRQKRLALVQFWLVVDGLRNPLEEDISSSDDGQESPSSTTLPAWTTSDRNDLTQIHDAYLSIPELQISQKSKDSVKKFLQAGSKATQGQYSRARAAVLRAQTTVLEEMQKKDFNEFKGSDLFYKYLASDETAAAQGRPSPRASTAEMHRSSSWTESSQVQDPPEDLLTSQHSFDGSQPLESTLEDWDFDPLCASRQNIEDEKFSPRDQIYPPPSQAALERRKQTPENEIVEAMEAALNDIIDERPNSLDESRGSLFQNSPDLVLTSPNSPRSSIDVPRDTSNGNGNGQKSAPAILKEREKTKAPSISSLGLVNFSTKDAVFADELFPDEDVAADYTSSGGENDDREGLYETNGSEEEIHQAAPGDLGLAEAISILTFDIEKLSTQEAVIDSLYRKAELTNNTIELRILRKSKSSLQREIRRKELQRQQYIVQESDNGLFGRSAIRIKSTMVGNENGQEYALYIIEVQRKGGEQMPAAQWAVARRYSEFFQLHQQLRAKFDSVKQLEFPRRRVVMKLQKDFLEKRRIALDKYLKSVLLIPDVCRSRELRAFLSQQSIAPQSNLTQSNPDEDRRDIISRLYNSIADGMEDVLGNIPILDQLSLSSANIITTTATSQMQSPRKTNLGGGGMLDVAEAEAELSAFEDKEVEPFVKPICDLFLEVFELNRGSNWLRGRAVVVVLHQLLGGTIERKAREQTKSFLDEESILKYIRLLKDSIWLEGSPQQRAKTRTLKEKSKTRTEAGLMLATLLPDVAASVVGRANAQAAGRRLFAAFNNQRLNTSISYSILDEIVSIVFDDIRR